MARALSPWCKQAKIRLIQLDMTVAELADKVGLTREYTSAIVNGRAYSEQAVKAISDVLNIEETACSLS
nr:MAG TPA: Helix-turn-helix XRE-family like protein [Caudoviricetes sp.]